MKTSARVGAFLLIAFASAVPMLSAETAAGADAADACFPHTQAVEKIGEVACITGKVANVHGARSGVTYLDVCRDYRDCSFSVVVLGADARRLGDLSVLQGREIRITGVVVRRGNRAEMLWRKPDQLQVAADGK